MRRAIIPLAFLVLVFCGEYEETRFPMGTYVRIKVLGPSQDALKECADSAFAEIDRIETLTSHFNSKGALTTFNMEHRVVDAELSDLVRKALEVSRLSNGAFDPTVYPVLELWGFYDSTDSARRIPPGDQIKEILQYVDWRKVDVSGDTLSVNGVRLDLSGIAKGYAVDKAVEVLENQGVRKGLVDAGGDIRCFGRKNGGWNIGIRDPRIRDPRIHDTGGEDLLGIVNIPEGAIATSGDYENYFEVEGIRYHHLMNPRTGEPAREAISATVIARTALQADAWATALFVMGTKGIAVLDSADSLEGLLVLTDGSIIKTKGFPEFEEK